MRVPQVPVNRSSGADDQCLYLYSISDFWVASGSFCSPLRAAPKMGQTAFSLPDFSLHSLVRIVISATSAYGSCHLLRGKAIVGEEKKLSLRFLHEERAPTNSPSAVKPFRYPLGSVSFSPVPSLRAGLTSPIGNPATDPGHARKFNNSFGPYQSLLHIQGIL